MNTTQRIGVLVVKAKCNSTQCGGAIQPMLVLNRASTAVEVWCPFCSARQLISYTNEAWCRAKKFKWLEV